MVRPREETSPAGSGLAKSPVAALTRSRLRIEIEGVVQGVGFRPFVYRLADQLHLGGWVRNDARGVVVEIEGSAAAIGRFREILTAKPPPRARLETVRTAWIPSLGEPAFTIVESEKGSAPSVPVLSDAATCAECLEEVETPANRRFKSCRSTICRP